jgi:hypothetical protein
MSPLVFEVIYLAGAGLLAVWFDLRIPKLRPSGWGRMGIAVLVSMVVDDLCTNVLTVGPRLVGVMAAALPALVLSFLVSIWLLRMMRSAMPT